MERRRQEEGGESREEKDCGRACRAAAAMSQTILTTSFRDGAEHNHPFPVVKNYQPGRTQDTLAGGACMPHPVPIGMAGQLKEQ